MPGLVQAGAVGAPPRVLPAALAEAFSSSREFRGRVNTIADGRDVRVADSTISRKRFEQTRALKATQMAELQTFVEQEPGGAFYFYNTLEGVHDPSGALTAGRYKCTFEGDFSREVLMGRSRASFALIEVA